MNYPEIMAFIREHSILFWYTPDDKKEEIITDKIFTQQFSVKLFRQQLAFHKDIDYSEPVEFLVQPVPEDEIKSFLIDKATDIFDE